MRERVTVRSLTESHRAKVTRPSRRILLSQSGQSDTKKATTQKNTDAATLYENILTIQNAADLEWPATDPANAGVRDEFQLGIFPTDHGGNHTPPPTPPPATPPAK
jgi:hypothetical protein